MKHMWSEEEIQDLIEEQGGSGGSGTINLDDIIDSQSNNRFIIGYGLWDSVPGMTPINARWSLNGYNLMFEALGSFQTNVDPNTTIVSFKLPQWILNRITTPIEGVIDIFRFSIVGTTGDFSNATLLIAKTTDGKVAFNACEGITFTEPKIFRIRYNVIIE